MLPIGDVNPRRRFPVVTVVIIVINLLVFVYQNLLTDPALERFVLSAGMVPYLVTNTFGPSTAITLLTSAFLHGSWMHILSNMLYLWIFGDNVEDRLGPLGFVLFYLAAAVAAGLAQVLVYPASQIPTIGASGAVAGVLGAYAVLYPRTRVRTLIFLFYIVRIVQLPALIVLGFWFVTQLFSGLAAITTMSMGGVAWFAHIGGFVAGLIVGRIVKPAQRPAPRGLYR